MLDLGIYNDEQLIDDEVSLITQQIDILFDTAKREVLGSPEYGTDYYQFLHNLTLSNETIAYYVKNDISHLELFGFEPEVDVSIVEGTMNDIILIKVGLRRSDEYYEKTYCLK